MAIFYRFHGIHIFRTLVLCGIFLGAFSFSLVANASIENKDRSLRAALIVPSVEARFWGNVIDVAQIAAHELSMDLKIYNFQSDKIKFLQIIHDLSKQQEKPDVVLFNVTSEDDMIVFEKLDEAGINFIVFNTGLGDAKNKEVGGPRGKYKHWIAQIVPNDIAVGKDMALDLYHEAKKKKSSAEQGLVYVSAVQGRERTVASDQRVKGLVLASAEHEDFILSAISSGFWSQSKSYNAALRLLDRSITPDVIWTAGDMSAISVVKALEDKGLVPGKDVITAGIDWDEYIFEYIDDGRVYASYGGHFMDAAWALMLAYDYHHGHDFIDDVGVRIFSPLSRIDQMNLSKIRPALEQKKWHDIKFKMLTKTHNPDFAHYDFNVLHHLNIE